MEEKKAEKEIEDVMLYVGSGTDAYPLTCPTLRKTFSKFVYADELPDFGVNKHNFPRTVKGLLLQLCLQGGTYAGLRFCDFTQQDDGGWTTALKDECKFVYYLNSDNVSAVPTSTLDKVSTIYIHGYLPPQSILESLPNVRKVFSTGGLVGELYWAVFKKSGVPIEVWNNTTWTYETTWSSERKCFEISGDYSCAPFFSDAPVQEKLSDYEDD